MLSILIPVYNYNVVDLVNSLHEQAVESLVDFEIIVMEDGSVSFTDINKSIGNLNNCRHIQLPKNIGRSAIRNKLADEAKYDHLLFLDCDAGISNKYFIQKYLAFCHENCVVAGGRIYQEKIEPQFSLLSKYGRMRERNELHNIKKYKNFTSPNFLISKPVFNSIRFDESIKGYGHEDTVFGIMLKEKNIEVKYIDNPVVHIGIEDNVTFIAKTEKGINNLYTLYSSGKYSSLASESKILSFYLKLKKYRLTFAVRGMHTAFKGLIRKNLVSKDPSLFLYDVYKLGVLCSCTRKS